MQDITKSSLTHLYDVEIEDYLKRREILEQQKKDRAEAKEKGHDVYQVTDEDIAEYEEMRRQQIAEDAVTMNQESDDE